MRLAMVTLAMVPASPLDRAVIPALVAGIHGPARSDASGWLDTGDKPRYDIWSSLFGAIC
jgi:hypothetical protein